MYLTDKIAFVRPPKVASTWVVHCLRDGLGMAEQNNSLPQHAGWEEVRHVVGDRIPFTVVRNPLTWLPSMYRQMRGGKMNKIRWMPIEGPCSIFSSLEHGTFHEFVEDVLRYPGVCGHIFRDYEVEHVLKQESIRQDLHDFLVKVGVEFDPTTLITFPPQNVTNERSMQIDCTWTRDLKERVIASEWDFMQRWGYV